MTDDQAEQVDMITEVLWGEIHDLVDTKLSGIDPVVDASVREQLTEQFRFWKRG